MKAEINSQGELVVTAESELEKYALDMWYAVHNDICDREIAGGEKDLVISLAYEPRLLEVTPK